MEESRSAFKIVTGKPRGKRPSGKPRSRWEQSIILDLKDIGVLRNWIGWAQDRYYWRVLVYAALNL